MTIGPRANLGFGECRFSERLRRFDHGLAVTNVRRLTDVVATAVAGPRINLLLVGGFALLALALAAIGIYGVIGYVVAQRTRELGIRIALGAQSEDVVRTVLGVGMRPVLAGVITGCVGALAAGRAIRGLLFGVAPFDSVSFAAAAILVLTVAAVATVIPVFRATRVDPLLVLRDE